MKNENGGVNDERSAKYMHRMPPTPTPPWRHVPGDHPVRHPDLGPARGPSRLGEGGGGWNGGSSPLTRPLPVGGGRGAAPEADAGGGAHHAGVRCRGPAELGTALA